MTKFFDVVQKQMRFLLPLGFLVAVLQISRDLLIDNDSFVRTVLSTGNAINWLRPINRVIGLVSTNATSLIIAGVVALTVHAYLESRPDGWLWSASTFLVVWTFENSEPSGVNWLIALVFTGLALGIHKLLSRLKGAKNPVALIIFFGLMAGTAWVNDLGTQSPMILGLRYLSQLIESGTQNFWYVLLWSLGGVTLSALGLIVPSLINTGSNMMAVDLSNLEAHWASPNAALPSPDTFYTLLKPFVFGLSGALLGLALAIWLINWRTNRSNRLWSWIVLSGLFNQTVPLVMAAPLLWRWRVWLRTAMVVVVNIIIGYGLIAIDWIKPAVFQVPKGTPMVLFGYFGTNADWHYLIVIPILLVIDIAIYWTLAKSIVKENADEVDA